MKGSTVDRPRYQHTGLCASVGRGVASARRDNRQTTCRRYCAMGDSLALFARVLCDSNSSAGFRSTLDARTGHFADWCLGRLALACLAGRGNRSLAPACRVARRGKSQRADGSRRQNRGNLPGERCIGVLDIGPGFQPIPETDRSKSVGGECALDSLRRINGFKIDVVAAGGTARG